MFAKYFEYYTIILGGAVFSWTCCLMSTSAMQDSHNNKSKHKNELNQRNTQNAKQKMHKELNLNLNQHSSFRTAHMHVCNMHNCCTQHSTEQF